MWKILLLCLVAIIGCAAFLWHALEPRRQRVETPYDREGQP